MDIALRKWAPEDLQDLVRLADNPAIARWLMDRFPNPYTEADGIDFLRIAMRDYTPTIMAITCDGALCGSIGLHRQEDVFCKNMELGYWIGEEFWNRGIASKAISLIVRNGFAHFDIARIFARPFGRNAASIRVLEKCGFVLEARLTKTIFKNNNWEDELIYGIRR